MDIYTVMTVNGDNDFGEMRTFSDRTRALDHAWKVAGDGSREATEEEISEAKKTCPQIIGGFVTPEKAAIVFQAMVEG